MQIITKNRLCFMLILFFIGGIGAAQNTEGFSYQSILRDSSGNPIQQQSVTVDITITEQSANGNAIYQENHTVTTSDIGLISIVIGNGNATSGNFQNIDWSSGPHFVTSSSTPAGGTAITGSSQLLSVPYAKFASVSGQTNQQNTNGWSLDGNSIDENTDFLGSTNDADVRIRRNNQTVANLQATNVGLGLNAIDNITGTANIGIGNNALANTSGQYNVAIGDNALPLNTSGDHNIGLGFVALNQNTTGNENIGLGNNALTNNTTGSRNIALGAVSLFSNTTGERNLAIGGDALNQNTTGDENIAIGQSALNQMNNGFVNVAVGIRALEQNTSGNENIAIGLEAMKDAQTTRQIGIGVNALRNATAASFDNIALGNEALFSLTDGGGNLAIGQNALGNVTTATNNVAVGNASLENTTGEGNTALGVGTLAANTTGSFNTAIGISALRQMVDASGNTAIGGGAMENSTSGFANVAIGNLALVNSNGLANIAIGTSALQNVQSQQNIGLGFSVMTSLDGSAGGANSGRNIAIGSFSLNAMTEGVNNINMGTGGLGALSNGNRNVNLGVFSGSELVTGDENTFVGYAAGNNISNGTGNIFIGSESIVGSDDTVNFDVSNQLNIGNSIFGNLNTNLFGFGVRNPAVRIDATGGNVKAANFISSTTTYPDYVFETYFKGSSNLSEDYKFQDLSQIEQFVKENNHLPGIKSHKEVSENEMNVNISELVVKSLEKIEELYLYSIEQQKEIEKLRKELDALKK